MASNWKRNTRDFLIGFVTVIGVGIPILYSSSGSTARQQEGSYSTDEVQLLPEPSSLNKPDHYQNKSAPSKKTSQPNKQPQKANNLEAKTEEAPPLSYFDDYYLNKYLPHRASGERTIDELVADWNAHLISPEMQKAERAIEEYLTENIKRKRSSDHWAYADLLRAKPDFYATKAERRLLTRYSLESRYKEEEK